MDKEAWNWMYDMQNILYDKKVIDKKEYNKLVRQLNLIERE